ncbi:hypothetical protein BASA61_005310 [Batrachochytrium salamandrivorans]|nr:hypothetical protein BASA61_005310 [Batrachochytrium salamandrivorans]
MFSLFDGDFKGRRNISLGGSRSGGNSRQDKDALLRQAQLDRQMRDLERRRLTGAIQIQAFYRSRRAFRKECQLQRDIFDMGWTPASASADASVSTASNEGGIAVLVMTRTARLLCFWNANSDVARLNTLVGWLMECTDNYCDGINTSSSASQKVPNVIIPFIECPDHGQRWILLLTRLVDKLLFIIANQEPGTGNIHLSSSSVALMQHIFNEKICENHKSQTTSLARSSHFHPSSEEDSHHSLKTEIFLNTSSLLLLNKLRVSIIQLGLFQYVRKSIFKQISDVNTYSVEMASRIAVIALSFFVRAPVFHDMILADFAVHILTIPSISSRMAPVSWKEIQRVIPFSKLTATLDSKLFIKDHDMEESCKTNLYSSSFNIEQISDSDSLVALVDSYMMLAESYLADVSTQLAAPGDVLVLYIGCVSKLLYRLDINLFRQFDSKAQKLAVDLDSFTEPLVSTSMAEHPISSLVSRLSNARHITAILRACQSPHQFSSALTYLANVLVLCSSRRNDILSTLAFHSELNLLSRIWKLLRSDPQWATISTLTNEVVLSNLSQNSALWNTFVVLAELMSRELLALGDDELFDSSFSFGRVDLIELCTAVKNIAISLCWTQTLDFPEDSAHLLPLEYLRHLFTRLMQQLHARDSRKPFCPPDHWLMDSAINGEAFVRLIMDTHPSATTPSYGPSQRSLRSAACHVILSKIPFVVPFEYRVMILRHWIHADRESVVSSVYGPVVRATIRRSSVFEDGFEYLNSLGPTLKGRVSVSFVDEHGLPEAGIDGGGVFKEFLTLCLKQAFDSNYGLFETTKDQLLFPSTSVYATQDSQLKLMEFLGRIIGKALYDGVLLDSAFAAFFLAKWLGKRSYLDDLPSLDPEFYNGLLFLKKYDGDVEKDLALNFTISENEFGMAKTVNLVPDGGNIPVTNENRIRYIYLTANYRLNIKIAKQCQAFFRGLSDLIDPNWLKLFNEEELQVLLGGSAVPIDIEDLSRNTVYSGVYDSQYPTIVMFWTAVSGFDEDQRRKLVKYVTSCSRPPILGFRELQPLFSIRDAGVDQERLPTASTCVNLLKLPRYDSVDTLRRKLLYAIDSDAGFELS